MLYTSIYVSLSQPGICSQENFGFLFPNILQKSTNMTALAVLHKFWLEYAKNTPKKLKIIDAYLLYVFLTGVTQFIYCCLVGTFPFNSFLSGFISCVSCFILGGNVLFVSFYLLCIFFAWLRNFLSIICLKYFWYICTKNILNIFYWKIFILVVVFILIYF